MPNRPKKNAPTITKPNSFHTANSTLLSSTIYFHFSWFLTKWINFYDILWWQREYKENVGRISKSKIKILNEMNFFIHKINFHGHFFGVFYLNSHCINIPFCFILVNASAAVINAKVFILIYLLPPPFLLCT